MQHPSPRFARPVSFINVRDLILLAHQGVQYGTGRFMPPVFAGHGTTGCPESGITYIRPEPALPLAVEAG